MATILNMPSFFSDAKIVKTSGKHQTSFTGTQLSMDTVCKRIAVTAAVVEQQKHNVLAYNNNWLIVG